MGLFCDIIGVCMHLHLHFMIFNIGTAGYYAQIGESWYTYSNLHNVPTSFTCECLVKMLFLLVYKGSERCKSECVCEGRWLVVLWRLRKSVQFANEVFVKSVSCLLIGQLPIFRRFYWSKIGWWFNPIVHVRGSQGSLGCRPKCVQILQNWWFIQNF